MTTQKRSLTNTIRADDGIGSYLVQNVKKLRNTRHRAFISLFWLHCAEMVNDIFKFEKFLPETVDGEKLESVPCFSVFEMSFEEFNQMTIHFDKGGILYLFSRRRERHFGDKKNGDIQFEQGFKIMI